MIATAVALLLLQVGSGAPAPRGPVQMGTAVKPETVTVGQHFTVTVRLRVPAVAHVVFPTGTGSTAAVDTAGPMRRQERTAAGTTEITAAYVMAAWDTGATRFDLGTLTIALPGGTQTVRVGDLYVYVRSVLPADTALRRPRPPRPPVRVVTTDWLPWVVAAAVLALLGGAVWLWRRRRAALAQPLTPLAWAERELDRLEASGMADADPTRYAIAASDVLRQFLARSDASLRVSYTTRELLRALAPVAVAPGDRVVAVLDYVDPLKFAARSASAPDARRVGVEVREVVREVHRRTVAAAEALEGTVAGPVAGGRAAA